MPDSSYVLPALVVGVLLCALRARVNVYDAFVSGAREGLKALLVVTPYLCAMLMATALWRETGVLAALEGAEPLMVYEEDYFAGAPAVTRHRFGEGQAYYLATRFETAFYPAFYQPLCAGLSAWPGALPEGVLACRRGPYVFLQNTLCTRVQGDGFDLPPYATAVYRRDGDALTCVFSQPEFRWSPVK